MKMDTDNVKYGDLKFEEMEGPFFLTGLMNEFMNRFQTVGDNFIKEISWKQCFTIICIGLFEQPPTLKDLSETLGCSHQNAKQMLLKLEKEGYVSLVADKSDKRKQRIITTKKAEELSKKYDKPSQVMVDKLFLNVSKEDLEITIKTIMSIDMQLKELAKEMKKQV